MTWIQTETWCKCSQMEWNTAAVTNNFINNVIKTDNIN